MLLKGIPKERCGQTRGEPSTSVPRGQGEEVNRAQGAGRNEDTVSWTAMVGAFPDCGKKTPEGPLLGRVPGIFSRVGDCQAL
jgi:hypothetical protein